MRQSLVGAMLVAGLVIATTAVRTSSQTAVGTPVDFPSRVASGELITHVTAADGLPQVVTVIDPQQRVMAVYHVDRQSGEITPKSFRNITWDLQMMDWNSGKPLPHEIRSGLPH